MKAIKQTMEDVLMSIAIIGIILLVSPATRQNMVALYLKSIMTYH
jgi:hypothetical protein